MDVRTAEVPQDSVAGRSCTSGVADRVAVLTGGGDRPYVFGLCPALATDSMLVDVIGSDALEGPELRGTPGLRFLNLQGDWPPRGSGRGRLARVLRFYRELVRYVVTSAPRLLHILWNHHDKLELFDRTVLMLFYKLAGKIVVVTAHNVNTRKRDRTDSWLNRWTLRVQYHLADHIFVHSRQAAAELAEDFAIPSDRITTIPFGVNSSAPLTELTPVEAKARLGLADDERVILFFGRIQPYKGLEYLVAAVEQLVSKGDARYRLIVAGEPMKEHWASWRPIEDRLREGPLRERTILRASHIPDADAELYYKAADVAVLPYRAVYQSGILMLAYKFGLPVVATTVGSFSDVVVEGSTGFLCRPGDAEELVRALEKYFQSDLYRNLGEHRERIRRFSEARYSWRAIAQITQNVYRSLVSSSF